MAGRRIVCRHVAGCAGVLVAAMGLAATSMAKPADAAALPHWKHDGVTFMAEAADPHRHFDITIVPPRKGLQAVQRALDRLLQASSFARKQIGKLQAAGRVVLVYDPNFPRRQLTGITIAAFFPEFFKRHGRDKDFVAVVGRFGVKWPTDQLAAVLAHELVGHGIQHLNGDLKRIRNVDLECEAYLYEEQAYQDLGVNKYTPEMIKFRQALENHWCADFKLWMRRHIPDASAYWDKLNPSVPKILQIFKQYTEDLLKTGVAGKAIAAARAERLKMTEERIATLEKAGTPAADFTLGRMYDRGLGVKQDGSRARAWYERAAVAGHHGAQMALGYMLYRGDGVPRDRAEARRWLTLAAEGGEAEAQALLGQMWVNGEGGPRDLATGRKWLERAAAQGHAGAKKALAILDARRAEGAGSGG